MTLTKTQRLILANQYRILALLDSANAKSHERAQEALESGYESAIENLFNPIFDGLDSHECGVVNRIMAMYEALQRSQAALGTDGGIRTEEVHFPGFDGNNETAYMSYARYIVEFENRFTDLKPIGGSFNSHMPSLARYRAMLGEWEVLGERYDLTEGEIRRLLDAR